MRWVLAATAAGLLLLVAAASAGCGGDSGSASPPPVRTAAMWTGLPHVSQVLGTPSAPVRAPAGARTDYPVPAFTTLAARFAYDRAAPLDLRIHGQTSGRRVTLLDVSFRGAGHRVKAWLVLPVARRPVPAVLYLHGYAGTRDTLLGQAELFMGPRGVAGLVIEARQNPWTLDARQVARAWTSLLIDTRRGLDLLQALPQIDEQRLAFVGLHQGADAGAILSGIDRRVRTYALFSPDAYLNTTARFDGCGPELLRAGEEGRFLAQVFAFSPVLYVPHSQGASFLLLQSRTDPEYPLPYARALFAAAPRPKKLMWYEAGHFIDADTYRLQAEWLAKNL